MLIIWVSLGQIPNLRKVELVMIKMGDVTISTHKYWMLKKIMIVFMCVLGQGCH